MAGLFTTDQLKAILRGGAKADKFTLQWGTPKGIPSVAMSENEYALVKSINMVGKELGTVEAWVQGRKLMIPGDSAFSNRLSCTVYNTPTHDIRTKLLNWMAAIDKFESNWHTIDPWDYVVDIELSQMGVNGVDAEKLKTYKYKDCFPITIGDINMDAANINQITTFEVTFAFTYVAEQ